jgi:RNA polymerase sigma-70 factor, ECF subfamily
MNCAAIDGCQWLEIPFVVPSPVTLSTRAGTYAFRPNLRASPVVDDGDRASDSPGGWDDGTVAEAIRGNLAEAIRTGVARGSAEVALMTAVQAGDAAAFDALIRPRMERLLRLAISIVGNESDARDAVQDGCLQAWREAPRLRDPERFEAWLWRIVINRCRTTLRSRRRTSVREIAVDDMPPGRELRDPARTLGDELSGMDTIRRALGRLDPDRRTILVLHHVEHRPVTEIADLLGVPLGTAKWRLHAARQALERALEVEDR